MKKQFLLQALKLAEKRRGFCAPNPAVGAILVKNGQVIGEGNHWAAGCPHAEINAIHAAGPAAHSATLYLTLEPCCHFGRTPPCTQAIIDAGITAVYFAFLDPNPQIAGQGQKALIQAGITCDHIPVTEINAFYQSYQYWTETKTPWVTAKLAITLDGKIAYPDGSPAPITGPALNQFTHQQRLKTDAILSTVNTVIHDDPQLNIRLPELTETKNIYLLDSKLRFPLDMPLRLQAKSLTLFHDDLASNRVEKFSERGIRCVSVPRHASGLDLKTALQQIGADGVHDLWVEAGAQCFNQFLMQKLANEIYIYIAAKTLGNQAINAFTEAFDLNHYAFIHWENVGNDVICHLKN